MSEASEKFTNVYINNIDPCISSVDLKEICERYGGRVVSAIVIKERGVSLGYGFCNFASHEEAVHAVEEMNNLFIMGKRLAVSRAASKADRAKFLRSVHSPSGRPGENANVYVKNLDYSIDEEALRAHFRPFGPIINVRIMRDDIGNSKGYGFVSYAQHADAAKAVRALDRRCIGKLAIHVDFYEPKKGKKKAPLGASASAPASPAESYSKARPSASALVTPVQSKVPSPLVIPSNFEESAFYCGTPINHEEVSDIDQVESLDDDDEGNENYSSSLVIERKKKEFTMVEDDEDEEDNKKDNTTLLIEKKSGTSTAMTMEGFNFSALPSIVSTRLNWNHRGYTGESLMDMNNKDGNGGKGEVDCPAIPRISQLIGRHHTAAAAAYKENEIKVRGLRYFDDEKDVLRLFYDFKCVGARPALNARGIRTGEWYVTFATRLDAERALAMCNDECFVVRGYKVRAERVPLAERPELAFPTFPAFRFAKKELLIEKKEEEEEHDCENEPYAFPSLLDDMSVYSDFTKLYC